MSNSRVNCGSKESGLLMPFRSLPGDHDHQGTLGTESIEFLETMRQSGFTVLQDLPNSPPDSFGSPYSSDSAFAIDPQRIDFYQLADTVDINRFDLDHYQKLAQSGNAGPAIKDYKKGLLRQAFIEFSRSGSPERKEDFARWCEEEAEWLGKFAAYEILKNLPQNSDWRWQKWETGKDYSLGLVDDIKFYFEQEFSAICYEQWIVNQQTLRYLQEADQRGIEVWGDVPFYVSGGEVWANRDIFNLDADGNQLNQGGAAPSMTSATGQMWGFATYNHGGDNREQRAKVVDWWVRRLDRAKRLSNGKVRLDHFIGLAEPYIIAADAKDGLDGYRDRGIGEYVLNMLGDKYGKDLPFYPEDLGTQTDETPRLREKYKLDRNTLLVRGHTKHLVLGQYEESFHNPDNLDENSVNISSNHDSPPLIEAMNSVRVSHPAEFGRYILHLSHLGAHEGTSSSELAQIEMRRLMHSIGGYAIMGIWDVLKLGPEGRYNIPDTVQSTNWSWRMDSSHSSELRGQIAYWSNLNESSGRYYSTHVIATAAD